ncbi:hypothetical protein MHU86_15482 [Fragilaria crotonensis]|nr:hypothetical protein MHU86_15482 [Fragilaria crotonensis]
MRSPPVESIRSSVRSGPPSNVSEAEMLDQVSELPGSSPVLQMRGASTAPISSNIDPGDMLNVDQSIRSAPHGLSTDSIFRGENPRSVPGTDGPEIRSKTGGTMPNARASTFRGNPVDIDLRAPPASRPNTDSRPEYHRGYETYYDGRSTAGETNEIPNPPRRGVLFDYPIGRTPNTRTPTRSHPFVDEVSFGPESFQDYMSQFQFREVKFKDFNKIVIPKFDSHRGDSFVHWYKLLVSSCLQWGVWCPPYESIEEDNIYGAWWELLPQSVRDKESFMAHLIFTLLIRPEIFPPHSKELAAVEGSSANKGYNAIYNILRLHHPLLHSVLSMANEIPRHRRAEPFSLYLRRLQEFFARERLATRTYTESEALDLAVRNLSTEWRNEFRRLVERDKRTGHQGSLPFKLALSQIATTFMEYADEIGRDPPGSHTNHPPSRSTPTAIMRRLEADPDVDDDNAILPEADVDLIVLAIASNQASSTVCLGCGMSGHSLIDCNRFVDYIVAESLAQRHPALRTQIANSHSQFRSRLTAATARSRAPASAARAVRSLQMSATAKDIPSPPDDPDIDQSHPSHASDSTADSGDYRQHSVHMIDGTVLSDDFESCFDPVTIRSVELLGVNQDVPSSAETVSILPSPAPTLPGVMRRLAATYDAVTSSSYAHADNGSMANTVNDASLLFAYRPIQNSKVRLLDAGDHVHHPLGVGFLCVPTTDRGITGAPTSIYIRTYHTPTIPGIILSHAAISKRLRTSSYFASSHADDVGFIHFPHRLRRCQDVYINIQPTSKRGGLTFTEALILPTDEQHTAALTPSMHVLRLCSDHCNPPSPEQLVDPTDGMYCQACQLPPLSSDFR